MHILDPIFMCIVDVLIRMHILDVLLLLLATLVIAPLSWEFQPQVNDAAGSVVVPKKTTFVWAPLGPLWASLGPLWAPQGPCGLP